MLRAMVIGCPGAGKSTFARKLRDITGLPLYYLDMLWHKPDKTNISREEFDRKLRVILEKDKWIIDGNYQRTLEMRLRKCDTIFLLDFSTEDCIAGAQSRIGKKREEMPWIETEFDEEFKRAIMDFHAMKIPQIYRLLSAYQDGREIAIFRSRKEADAYIERYGESRENI